MCNLFTLEAPAAELEAVFQVVWRNEWLETSEFRPTDAITVVRWSPERGLESARCRWGLVPAWSQGPTDKRLTLLTNARAETVEVKPSFRQAFKARRCLVPATGFVEWVQKPGRKEKTVISPYDSGTMAFAGLWERWTPPIGADLDTQPVDSVTIVTTQANAFVSDMHDRMPVILDACDWDAWLNPKSAKSALKSLLKPAAEGCLRARALEAQSQGFLF